MADYKSNTLATESIEWTTANGHAIVVVVTLAQQVTDYFGNSDWQPVRDGLNIRVTATAAGNDQGIGGVVPVKGHPEYVARIGQVGLTAERKATVDAAIAALKNHPAWIAKVAAFDAGIKADREYAAHTRAVNKMMTPGGSC